MFKLSDNSIIVSEHIVDTTAVIEFDGEELILTEISIKDYAHTIHLYERNNVSVWTIMYLRDDNYFNEFVTRKILFEKTQHIKYCWFNWHYDFYEPVEIVGKGNQVWKYKQLFIDIANNGGTFVPEKTLLLRRKCEV